MSPPTKQEEIGAGSSGPLALLPDEMDTDQATRTAESTSEWQFLKQGYDWTGGSLRTKGYRTDFDSVREPAIPAREPAAPPSQHNPTSVAGRLDWRHPEHLGVVAEFVSSLTPPAVSAPALNILKPIKPTQRTLWHLLGLGLVAGGLLALVSFPLGDWQGPDTRSQPLEVAAVSPSSLPAPAEATPSNMPSPPLPGTADAQPALTPIAGVLKDVVVSADRARWRPAAAARAARIDLEAREILVSGRAVAAVVMLKRTGSTRGPVRVRWKTVAGTATPGKDYESVSAIVKFADGQAVRTLFVPILQPPSRDEPRTFSITLQRLRNGPALGPVTSTAVTIWGDT